MLTKEGQFSHILKLKKPQSFVYKKHSSPEDEKLWSSEWGSKIVYAHRTTHSVQVYCRIN